MEEKEVLNALNTFMRDGAQNWNEEANDRSKRGFYSSVIDAVRGHLDVSSVLEIGMGNGAVLKAIAEAQKAAISAVGIELCPHSIAYAEKNLESIFSSIVRVGETTLEHYGGDNFTLETLMGPEHYPEGLDPETLYIINADICRYQEAINKSLSNCKPFDLAVVSLPGVSRLSLVTEPYSFEDFENSDTIHKRHLDFIERFRESAANVIDFSLAPRGKLLFVDSIPFDPSQINLSSSIYDYKRAFSEFLEENFFNDYTCLKGKFYTLISGVLEFKNQGMKVTDFEGKDCSDGADFYKYILLEKL